MSDYLNLNRTYGKRNGLFVVGTAGAWLLLDVTFYGNSVSSVLILQHLNISATLIANTLTAALIFFFFLFQVTFWPLPISTELVENLYKCLDF